MAARTSTSEENGIATLTGDDLRVYSVGISNCAAEFCMAEADPRRRITASTVDKEGVQLVKRRIATLKMNGRIEVRIEDVSEPLAYTEGNFDFIYARLVLHYLPKDGLVAALGELHRVLRPGGKMFAVVRSTDCEEATSKAISFDLVTNITTYSVHDPATGEVIRYASRYFHTEQSISDYVKGAGFEMQYIKTYDEQLYRGFMRQELSPVRNNVIELVAVKP